MKKENSFWLNLIFFLVGALISYFLCQFKCLNIDTKVNIPGTLISAITALIGLYLAISLKKIQTKSSNLHNYLQPKLDSTWKLFLAFSSQLNLNEQIELKEVTKSTKEILSNIVALKKIFTSFGLKCECVSALETNIESLEKFLVEQCPIELNVIKYEPNKDVLNTKLDGIHSNFVDALKEINKIS